MADELTPAVFSPQVGSDFTVEGAAATPSVVLHLDHLTEHAPSPGAPRQQPFTLTFVGPAGQHLPQGTYTLSHEPDTAHDIFLVPIGPLPDGRHRYEAVFN